MGALLFLIGMIALFIMMYVWASFVQIVMGHTKTAFSVFIGGIFLTLAVIYSSIDW